MANVSAIGAWVRRAVGAVVSGSRVVDDLFGIL